MKMREPCAEFLAVAIFTGLGIGVNCQTVLSQNPHVASSPKGVSFEYPYPLELFETINGRTGQQ
jgi:glycerol uptake facilitator-like aquaporin